ncbi:MAG: hypothetical protein J4473_00020 [Candidatus Aenigmarchaeota archaeon]|nr:hypothetical protein [Candidatus Aenigmarchaeota archaeon]
MKTVCYSIKHLTPVERTKLQRALYGFKDISNKGKYVYQRLGLMNNSDHKKIFFIGLIVKDNIVEDVVKILKKHKAKIHVTLDH